MKRLKIEVLYDHEIVENKFYYNYRQVLISTSVNTPMGNLNVLIKKRYTKYTIYGQFTDNGIYFKYPKQYRRMGGVNGAINDLLTNYWLKVYFKLLDHRKTRLMPETTFNYLDYFIHHGGLDDRKLGSILKLMEYANEHLMFNQLFILEAVSSLFKERTLIGSKLLKTWHLAVKSLDDFPSINLYEPRHNLLYYKLPNHTKIIHGEVKNMKYDDFLDTLEGLSYDDIMELVSNYRLLEPSDYNNKDIKRVLYRCVQAWQTQKK